MLSLLLKSVLWLFPLLTLLYFIAFCLKKSGRLTSSLFFSLFSFLTYMTHIYPHMLRESSCYLYWQEEHALTLENFKWAVVSQYVSSCFRNEFYLRELWESLRKKGFNALIVREISFNESCSGRSKESLKVFKDSLMENRPIHLALDHREVLAYRSTSVQGPIIWLDLHPEETNESSLPICNIISLEKNEWGLQKEFTAGEVIRLPFEKNRHWASLLSRIDVTVVHFSCKRLGEGEVHES